MPPERTQPDAHTPPLPQALRLLGRKVGSRLGLPGLYSLLARLQLWSWGARVGRRLKVRGFLRLLVRGRLILGDNVTLNSGRHNFVGGDRRMAIYVESGATLRIDEGCGLSSSTIYCEREIHILPHTFIGGGCEIYDTDFHQVDPDDRIARRDSVPSGPVSIGPKAFVGAFTIVLKNVTIGEGAVVGAGSVVTRSIPPYELWAGAPAVFKRALPRTGSQSGE